MPKFKPNTGYGKKPAAPKYIAPDNAMAANMAAQRNVMPNQPMGPFTMKYKNSSFPFKSSPAKDAPEATHPEHHETKEVDPMIGTSSDDRPNMVWSGTAWVGRGDDAGKKALQYAKDNPTD